MTNTEDVVSSQNALHDTVVYLDNSICNTDDIDQKYALQVMREFATELMTKDLSALRRSKYVKKSAEEYGTF